MMKKVKRETKSASGIREEIAIPADVEIQIEGERIIMKNKDVTITRILHPLINVKSEGKNLVLTTKKNRKIERRMMGTFFAHIKNMMRGFTEPFKYRLQVVNVHFPMTVSHDKEKKEIVIKNFLGEKKDRRVPLIDGVEVKVTKDIIELESADIEKAGQIATRIEKGARVRDKDRRIYQDGIFIIEKPGRSYL